MIGFGLCDGATALALFGDEAGLDGLILVNPWLVEAEAGAPAAGGDPAPLPQQLLSLEGWKKILSGAVNYRKLLTGLRKIFASTRRSPLAARSPRRWRGADCRPELILAAGDATAIAAEAELKAPAFEGPDRAPRDRSTAIPTPSPARATKRRCWRR